MGPGGAACPTAAPSWALGSGAARRDELAAGGLGPAARNRRRAPGQEEAGAGGLGERPARSGGAGAVFGRASIRIAAGFRGLAPASAAFVGPACPDRSPDDGRGAGYATQIPGTATFSNRCGVATALSG